MAHIMRSPTQNKEETAISRRKNWSQHLFELVLCAMFGSLMFASKVIMAMLPNIHLLGLLIVTLTVVFRWKALLSIYIYVLLDGLLTAGFAPWWWPYLYIWTILWGVTMLLPKRMPRMVACVVYTMVSALHGLLFGVLYAPFQALVYNLGWEGMLAWIASGIGFDFLHFLGNLGAGMFIMPVVELLRRLMRQFSRRF